MSGVLLVLRCVLLSWSIDMQEQNDPQPPPAIDRGQRRLPGDGAQKRELVALGLPSQAMSCTL